MSSTTKFVLWCALALVVSGRKVEEFVRVSEGAAGETKFVVEGEEEVGCGSLEWDVQATYCDRLRGSKGYHAWRSICDTPSSRLTHFTTSIATTSGNAVLQHATRMAFHYFLGHNPTWVRESVERTVEIDDETVGVVVGPGALMYANHIGSRQVLSGWEWPVSPDYVKGVDVPLFVFGVGWNRFRNTYEDYQGFPEKQFKNAFVESMEGLADRKNTTIVGLRDSFSLDAVATFAPRAEWRMTYQPCPTTLLALFNPCLAVPSPEKEEEHSIKILAVVVESDQRNSRYGEDVDAVMDELVAWILEASRTDGWEIHLVLHDGADHLLMDHVKAAKIASSSFKVISFGHLDVSTKEGWLEVVGYYRSVDVVASTREAAVTISFGVHTPSISLITHNKTRSFLEDVGHTEWGIELNPAYRQQPSSPLREELIALLRYFGANRAKIHGEIKIAQQFLAKTTASNMHAFATSLIPAQKYVKTRKRKKPAVVAHSNEKQQSVPHHLPSRIDVSLLPEKQHLAHYRDKHKGEDIYVIASGKSVDYLDPDFFQPRDVTIGVNQVYKRYPNLTYTMRKEDISSPIFRGVLEKTESSTIHFASRGPAGGPGNKNALSALTTMRDFKNIVVFEHPCHPLKCSKGRLTAEGIPSDDRLAISASTITSAIHLAAYMGARRILLVGHDCGTLDGETNFLGYHTAATIGVAWGHNEALAHERYARWISGAMGNINIQHDTYFLVKTLRARYGTQVHSINPFVDLRYENHTFKGSS